MSCLLDAAYSSCSCCRLFGKVVKDWPANRSTPISVLSFNAFPASPVMTTHKLRGTSSAPAEAFEKGSRLCYPADGNPAAAAIAISGLSATHNRLLTSMYSKYKPVQRIQSKQFAERDSACAGRNVNGTSEHRDSLTDRVREASMPVYQKA